MSDMTLEGLRQVLRVVAAATRRTFGEADVAIWHPIIKDVPVDFAKKAVVAHFQEHPGVWLEPGHIFQRWKSYRLDQVARESREMREARQAILDAKAKPDPDILALANSKAIPDEDLKYTRRGMGAKSIACPWCKARPKTPCVIPGTSEEFRRGVHPARTEAWERRSA